MRKRNVAPCCLLVLAVFCGHSLVYADAGQDISYAAQGATQIVGSAFAIPKAMLQDSGHVMFPFGLVTGAIRGTVQTVTGILGGAMNVARGAAPYAKYAALAAA